MKRSGGSARRAHAGFARRRTGWLTAAVVSACCVAGLAGAPVLALGAGSASGSAAGSLSSPSYPASATSPTSPTPAASLSAGGSGASSSLGVPLVTPESPAQGEQARAAEEARRNSPEARIAREKSRTAFAGLGAGAAAKLASERFPAVIDDPAGGPPQLPAGESVTAYPADNVAQLALPGGKHGVLESMEPIAVQTGPGQRVPVDLSLGEAGGAFEPKTPFVPVRIPKSLGAGLSLGSTGASLTPVDAQGSPLGGSEGALDGASVLYANTQTDADTVVKPTTAGFEADTVLRSVDSPEQLFFRVGLPEGASLVQTGDGSGPVEVIDKGATLATILPPGAHDAAGAAVPVSMSVSGDTVTLTVGHRAGGYLYPVEVDPEFRSDYDENLGGATLPTHWKFCTSVSNLCQHTESPFSSSGWGGTTLSDDAIAEYKTGQSAYFLYQSEGDSHVYEAKLYASAPDTGTNIETYFQLAGSGGVEETLPWEARNFGKVCAYSKGNNEKCERKEAEKAPDEYGAAGNWLHFEQSAYNSGSSFTNTMEKVDVSVAQEGEPEYSFNTTEEHLANAGGRTNVLAGKGSWLGPHNGAFELKFHDPGVGISMLEMYGGSWLVRHKFLEEGKCSGIFCSPTVDEAVTYSSSMPDGEDVIAADAEDSVGRYANPVGPGSETVKVDSTAPYNLAVTGLPASGVIDDGQFHLQAKATDGKAPARSSGIKALRLGLDGYTIPGGKSGSCPQGPCTASGEWTLSGESIGAGKHTLELVAEDNAENIETKKYTIAVQHAGALSVGPGSVDPITGALHLGANDVSLSGGLGSLGVSRGYNSRQLTGGEQGPLGPQWKLSVSGSQEIEQEPTGNVVMVNSGGARVSFESNGKGGFISPKGDENLVLEVEMEGIKVKAYVLKDPTAGTTIRYTQPGGFGPWVIASSEGALSKTSGEKETFEWERPLGGVTRPKLALAPAPAGVTCSPAVKEAKELEKGCRALSFIYATETTVTGEAPSEWKAYKGRLMTVSFTAYNPSTKTMETKPVAEYAYDKKGRLRAEWDPRISPALKTTYGYDAEGHITSVNPPGEEPSLFHYGTTASDATAGRLLSVTRPQAGSSTQVKEQDEKAVPVNEAAPALSSTGPAIGTTLSVSSNGTWSNSPLAYSYSWEDCYTYESKETCTAIPGAANGTYTPQPRDAGYTLRAQVTAVNADGAAVATTAASNAVAAVAPAYHSQFGKAGEAEGQFKGPAGDAIDPSGNVWVVDSSNSRVQELSASGTFMKAIGWGVSDGKAEFETCMSACKAGISGSGAGQFAKPEGIAINQTTKNVYVVDRGNNRIEEFNSEGKYVGTFGSYGKEPGQLNAPEGVAIVPAGAIITSSTSGEVWVGDSGNDRVDEFTESGEYIGSFGAEGSGEGQFKGPDGIAFSGEDVYVVDSGNDRVQELSMSGTYIAKFGAKGTGEGQFETPYGIATEPVSGDLYVADSANNRVEEFSPAGTFLVAYGKKGAGNGEFSSPQGIAVNPAGVNPAGYIYVTDTGNNRVQELEPKYSTNNPLPEPPALGTSAVSTIDYNVALEGAGAPHEMTKAELEKWGQSDDPIEATAIFPPDEPMGWPAKDYKRASITYYDEFGRTVNHASPSGGISTSEYNEDNEVIRSLSADNRAAALKEGCESKEKCKSAQEAKLLDTKSTYNPERTELLEVVGPEHLTGKGEGEARHNVIYRYDQGAPEGGHYDLLTETIDDGRTTKTSYSGQENLGWLLRKPTSVTNYLRGRNLAHTTAYNPFTGAVVESAAPGAEAAARYVAGYGSEGSGNGQFKCPSGVAGDAKGDVWVVDDCLNRLQELNAGGEYVRQIDWKTGTGNGEFGYRVGFAVGANGNLYLLDMNNNRVQELTPEGTYVTQWGSKGSENRQFNDPTAIAIDGKGNVWVLDTGNSRVQEFTAEGTFVKKFGSRGKENGQLEIPESGIAVTPAGDVWVGDSGNKRDEEFNPEGAYIRTVGLLKGITTDASGHLWGYDGEGGFEYSATGEYMGNFGDGFGEGWGQVLSLNGIAMDSSGNIWTADSHRLTRWSAAPTGARYASKFGTEGTGNGQFKKPAALATDAAGNVWVADSENNRAEKLSATGTFIQQITGVKDPEGVAVDASGDVWVSDSGENKIKEFSSTGALKQSIGGTGTENGQFKEPAGITVAGGVVYVVDRGNNRVQVFTEFAGEYFYSSQFGSSGTGNGQFKSPQGIAVNAEGHVFVSDSGNDRVEEFSEAGKYQRQFGAKGSGRGQLTDPYGVASDRSGHVWVADREDGRVEEFTAGGEYVSQLGSKGAGNGQFSLPKGVTVDDEGNVWVADTANNRVQRLASALVLAHTAQAVYYTAGANEAMPACGNHPEWADLPCRSQPAEQPLHGNPLPVVTTTYNMWDEPETVVEEFGSTTIRTKKLTYDAAGRALTSEETTTGSSDTAVPKVTSEYSSETGVMIKQSTTVGETTKSIKSVYDTLGQLTEYTDADGNPTQYVYSGPANDDQIEEVKYGGSKGSQMYSYNPTSKALEKLLDMGPEGGAGAGTFTASYDVEGKLTSETYPNGMAAKYTYNSVGEGTGVEYEKTTHCTEKCTWFSETVVPGIHGETLTRTSTLAKEEYTYDEAGRLTQVNETPAGKDCKTRMYVYDEESNRATETARESSTETCAKTGGASEEHSYDEANRLIDSGVEYEAFGNQTKIPAADAGAHEIIASFYADNQVAVQKQNEETTNYTYDPAGRTEKTVSEGTTKASVVNHYPGPGEAISWACEEAAKECEEGKGTKWTRDIPGIDGSLAATQHNSEAAVLQLHDLEGNVIATAAVSETETKLLTTYNPTEFGVPVNGTPPTKYSWLGASGYTPEQSSGAANPGGSTYVSQLGAPLQTEPITPPGAYANGSYNGAVYSPSPSAEDLAQGASYGAGAPAREAARLESQKEEAETRAYEGECHIASCVQHDGPGEGNCEANCTSSSAPTEAEWRAAEEAYYRAEGTVAYASRAWFEAWVDEVAHAGTGVGRWLIHNENFNTNNELRQAKSNWHFWMDFSSPEGVLDMTLSCAKKGLELVQEIGDTVPPPYAEFAMPLGQVLGCISGINGG
jgi:DNA-binding beta-propeller fold protein YncE